jgi:hypothetical protein
MSRQENNPIQALPSHEAQFVLDHFQIHNRYVLSHRMHELNKSISFFKDIHRLLNNGYRMDEPSAAFYLEEMNKRSHFLEEQVSILNNLLLRTLKTIEEQPTILPEDKTTCRN